MCNNIFVETEVGLPDFQFSKYRASGLQGHAMYLLASSYLQ